MRPADSDRGSAAYEPPTQTPVDLYDRRVWERQIVRFPRLRAALNFWRVREYDAEDFRIRYYHDGHRAIVLSVTSPLLEVVDD